MKPSIQLQFVFISIFFLSSCASIVSTEIYPFGISSIPKNADVIVKDQFGDVIFQGNTPTLVQLKTSRGYFKKAFYEVIISMEGYETKILPIEFNLDGWYFGNFLFGGIIGFLIIDPATGAMYKPKKAFINVKLSQTFSKSSIPQLQIIDINEIPDLEKVKLEKICIEE